MKSAVWLALLVVGMGGGLVRGAAATPIFLVDSDQATYDRFFRVDPVSGALTELGALPFDQFGAVLALAAASAQVLYAVAEGGALIELTPSPFAYAVVGNLGPNGVVGLAYAADGHLYATDEVSNLLSMITPSPFAVTPLGTIHVGSPSGPPLVISGGDLAQAPSGLWYLWTNAPERLYRLDVASAVATPVSPQPPGTGRLSGLAFDFDSGALLASTLDDAGTTAHALRTLDPTTGAATHSVRFCLSCPAVYPAISGDLASPFPGSDPPPTVPPCGLPGFDGLLCALGAMPPAALCAPGQMSAARERRLDAVIVSVRQLVAQAAAASPPRRALRLLKRARRRLVHLRASVLHAGRRSGLASPCRQALAGWLGDLQGRAAALLAP